MAPLLVVEDQPPIQIVLQLLHGLVQVFPYATLKSSSLSVRLKRSQKPLVFGVWTLVFRCSIYCTMR